MKTWENYQEFRPYLFSVAYRMLGSVAEAEDILQDAYLRVQHREPEAIRRPKAYLSQVVTRLCLDRLAVLKKERAAYEGPWLPEPLETPLPETYGKKESLSTAFLLLIEKLNPGERAVFLLREVFEHDYEDIAFVLGKTPENCRQIFRRARLKVQDDVPASRPEADDAAVRSLLERFIQLTEDDDLPGLQDLLVEQARLIADGGGKVRGAVRHILTGKAPVSKFLLGVTRKLRPESSRFEFRMINGRPAIVGINEARVYLVIAIRPEGEKIGDIFVTANPDKLQRLR